MRKFAILAVLVWAGIAAAGVALNVSQSGDSAVVRINPTDLGAYVRAIACGDTVFVGVFDTAAVVRIAVPACGSLMIYWTPIETISTSDVVLLDSFKVMIPGGWFRIGADDGDSMALVNSGADDVFLRKARPARWVYVDSFAIRTIEEPCSLFARFVGDGGYDDSTLWEMSEWEVADPAQSLAGWNFKVAHSLDGSSVVARCTDGALPVRDITFYEALAYAHWQGGTLPTRAQWEVAARLNSGWIFPWGDEFCIPDYPDSATANVSDGIQCAPDTFGGGPGVPQAFVLDRSPAGCLSMGGNLSEWCLDRYSDNYYPMLDPISPSIPADTSDYRTVSGGNYNTGYLYRSSVFERNAANPESTQAHIGLRVVWYVGDGKPNNWYADTFAFDMVPPETVAVVVPHGCLMNWLPDSFAVVFSEPVVGTVFVSPNLPASVYHRWNLARDTLWIVKQVIDTGLTDSICVDLSALEDTAGNHLGVSTPVCVPVCGSCIEVIQSPETLYSPVGCFAQAQLGIFNCSDIALRVDSVLTHSPFEVLGGVDVVAPGETTYLTVRFTPDCAGIISVPVLLYGNFGLFSAELVGYGCEEPLAVAQPPEINFGETCDTASEVLKIFLNGCSSGMFEVCDIRWDWGVYFTLDSLVEGDTLADSLVAWVRLDSVERGEMTDTLRITFRPVGGVCCENAGIAVPVSATCSGTGCEPSVEYDAVLADTAGYVRFSCVNGEVKIFSRTGRFVVKLVPDRLGFAEWNFEDENGNPVPAGVYFWVSGKKSGHIVILR